MRKGICFIISALPSLIYSISYFVASTRLVTWLCLRLARGSRRAASDRDQ